MSAPRRDNLAGGAWILADMSLNIWALAIVKALGLGYPPAQLVFLRAAVGLLVIAPWILRRRDLLRRPPDLPLHLLRVLLVTVALGANYYSVARVPFALFTAVNFTRPMLIMALAGWLLGERIGPGRWLAACVALAGVLIIVAPAFEIAAEGLPALALGILCGSGAIILLRRLRDTHPLILMTAYTLGLTLLSAPFALAAWQPVAPGDWPPLLAIGLFSQSAQLCFLNAHRLAEAGYLSVLGYLSIVLSTLAGALAFGEIPAASFYPGAALIVASGLWVGSRGRAVSPLRPGG